MINSWVQPQPTPPFVLNHLAAVVEDSEPVSPQAAEGPPSWGLLSIRATPRALSNPS